MDKKGVFHVNDLLNENNSFKTPQQFYSHHNLQTIFLEVLQVRQALPHSWRKKLKEANYCKTILKDEFYIKVNSKFIVAKKIKSSDLYWKIINRSNTVLKPTAQAKWQNKYEISDESFKKIYTLPFKCCKYTKYQSFQYKIIHRIVACNYWLAKMNIHETGKCSFCDEIDTIEHFFTQCPKTLLFWNMFYRWWNSLNVIHVIDIEVANIIFGHEGFDRYIKFLNYVLILAKYHIYSKKKNKSEPCFLTMLTDLKNQLYIDKEIASRNGKKTTFNNEYGFILDVL